MEKKKKKSKSSEKLLNIICLSNQLWDFENWTNKKHVMYRLAQSGHTVLFCDPPINTGFVFFKYAKKGYWGVLRLLIRLKRDTSSAYIYTPLNIIPFERITSFFHAFYIQFLSKFLFRKERNTVLWIYDVEIPYLDTYLNVIKRDYVVYDCVDNYEAFPRYNTKEKKEKIRDVERKLAERADVVFATAPGLVDKIKRYSKSVHYTPNVGDYERFKDSRKNKYTLPADIASIPSPRVGFVGALDKYKFDFDLMAKAARDYPDYSFVLIGQVALKDKSLSLSELGLDLPNVYFLGSKPYEEVSSYYAGFDAYIIPYVLNDYTVSGCFPVKFHDALAAGLPTVVTNLPAYAPFRDVCYIARNYSEFSAMVKTALDDDTISKVKERQKIASENSWDRKVANMLDIILKLGN
ncbi:glycosyltransferase [Patescibacteria group bacterium]|nr:glycosyltransferase [Patescibacteria group bacterium]